MAKMSQNTLVISVSKLLRDTEEDKSLVTPEIIEQLEAILVELVGEQAMVEVTLAEGE